MMNTIQPIDNDADCVPLFLPQSLFLKPFARINVSVTLPNSVTGKPISNFDIMEKLRSMVQPERFSMLKVSKSTLEFIRFEGELENSKEVSSVLARLDGRNIKLANFVELLKVRASLAKDSFPSRHAWDSYFRDARDMDEMKPGERPDTVHLSNLPIRWFCPRHQEHDENVRPSESIFRRIFEKFGQVRAVDIPICDPYRKEMKSQMAGVHTFSHDNEQYFDGYVQFEEYLGFTETMRAFRNMKLVRKEQKTYAINIVVDFDRKKHLSDASVKRRKVVRDRCVAKEQARDEEEKQKKLAELEKKEQIRKQEEAKRQLLVDQQLERENKRKEKQLQKLRSKEQVEISSKIRAEEKKLQLAQKKLESIRVLEALFERIKLKAPHKTVIKKEKPFGNIVKGPNGNGTTNTAPVARGDLRNKLVTRFKTSHEEDVERQRNRLMLAKSSGLLEAALKAGGERSPSVTSISSDDSVLSDKQKKKKKKAIKKKKKKKKEGSSSSSVSSALSEAEPIIPPLLGPHPLPGGFPMYNPETGQYIGMNMYSPFGNPFFPPGPIAARSEYYPPTMGYRGGGGQQVYRGGPRGRYIRGGGRGGMRGGRGGYNDGTQNRFDDEHDNRRGGRYSRSRSNSRGRRSYSRSRSHRSHSRTRRSRSKSKSKKKLVSTLRKSNSSTRWSSRSRSSSRSKDRRSWSRKSSRSRSRSRNRSRHASRSRSRSRSSRSRSRSSSHSRTRSRSNNKRNRSTSRAKSNGRHSRENMSKRATPKTPTEHKNRSRSRISSSKRDKNSRRSESPIEHSKNRSRSRISSSNRNKNSRRSESRDTSKPTRKNSSSPDNKRSRSESNQRSVSRELIAEDQNGRADSVDSTAFRSPKRMPVETTPDRIFDD